MPRSLLVLVSVTAIVAGGCTQSSSPASDASFAATPSSTAAAPSATFRLLPVFGAQPVWMSTSIGVLAWTTYAFPQGRALWDVLATEHGFVAASPPRTANDRSLVQWSADAVTWDGVETDSVETGDLTHAGDDVVLRAHGSARYTWDGARWARSRALDVPGSVLGLASGAAGTVATFESVDGVRFAHSTDGVTFAEVDGPVGEEVEGDLCGWSYDGWGPRGAQVLATQEGFVAMAASDRMDWGHRSLCEPLTWTSADGTAWTLRTPRSPFPRGQVVDLVAEREGRFVAVGHRPETSTWSAWTSGDAIAWEPLRADLTGLQGLSVSAGPLGWIITGVAADAEGVEALMWTSPDGLTWSGPYPLPEGFRSSNLVAELAIGTDTVFGLSGWGAMPVVARVVG